MDTTVTMAMAVKRMPTMMVLQTISSKIRTLKTTKRRKATILEMTRKKKKLSFMIFIAKAMMDTGANHMTDILMLMDVAIMDTRADKAKAITTDQISIVRNPVRVTPSKRKKRQKPNMISRKKKKRKRKKRNKLKKRKRQRRKLRMRTPQRMTKNF